MYKISDFANLSRVSAKMLRHYAALGLLMPAHTDLSTGYRYYTVDQLARLNRIVVLKDLGFALEQIAALLDDDLPLAQLHDALEHRRAEVAQRIAEDQRRLAELDRRLAELSTARPPAYEVLLRPLAPLPVAATRAVVASEGELGEVLSAVEAFVGRQRARAPRPATVIYHACAPGAMQVEVAVPIAAPIPSAAWVQPATLPAAPLMACVVHSGDDAGLIAACDALHQWVAAHGYRADGPYRERYLRYSSAAPLELPPTFAAPHPAAAVTELQLPVVLAQAT